MFQGLLLSRDDTVIRLFRRIHQELEMGLEVCTGAEQAMDQLSSRRFNAVIVDCDDVHSAPEVLQSLRGSTANRRATAFAILNGITSMRAAFDMGASLTLQKPFSLEHVRKSLRALRSLIEQENRRYYRVPVEFPVIILFDEKQEFPAMAVNISDGGMALRLQHPIPQHRAVSIRFCLPGASNRHEAKVSIAWSDSSGAAGVRFEYLTPGSRQELNVWLVRHLDVPKKQVAKTAERPVTKSMV